MEESVLVQRWVLEDISDVLRQMHNMIIENKMKSAFSRQVLTAESQLNKTLKDEEITGKEYLEAMRIVENI